MKKPRKIVMHQSQYLPWPPFFRKMALADIFVLMDCVQFQKNGLQNRNQINSSNGPLWLTLPVNSKLDEPIKDKVITDKRWKKKHLQSIQSSYGKSTFFHEYFDEIKAVIESADDTLFDINLRFIHFFRKVLSIDNELMLLSDLSITSSKSQLVLDTCIALNASEYLSGEGAKSYLDLDAFKANQITIRYVGSNTPAYKQIHPAMKHLSLLDWLFQEELDVIKDYIHDSKYN